MTTLYLSGPMRGLPEHNYPLFHAVETEISDELEVSTWCWLPDDSAVEIINPARNFGGDQNHTPVTDYLAVDIASVTRSDIIVLLPGWEASEGADREVTVARWLGKHFVTAEYSEKYEIWEFAEIDAPAQRNATPRGGILDEARALITGDRNNTYGPPTQDFSRSAKALNAYGYRGPDGRELQGHDIAVMIMSVKLSRLMWTKAKRDSWVDIAGYAGCGYECAISEAA